MKMTKNGTMTNPNVSIRVPTPVGNITVFIGEFDGKPRHLQIFGGKAGTEFFSHCATIAALGTELLEKDDGFEKLLEHLSSNTTSKSVREGDVVIRSGSEGIFNALLKYKHLKLKEFSEMFGSYRPATMHPLS